MQKKEVINSLNRVELADFCSQMAMLLQSGLLISESLYLIEEELPKTEDYSFIQKIITTMNDGKTFTESIESCAIFPHYMVEMIRIGESSGRLDDCLNSLSAYYEREELIIKSIRNAITYPLIMIGLMMIVVSVLVIKVLPIFNQVYAQLGTQLTGLAKSFLNLGSFLGNIALYCLILVIVLILMYFVFKKNGYNFLKSISNNISFIHNLNIKIGTGQFASGMALMLKSGLEPYHALELIVSLIDEPVTQTKAKNCFQYCASGIDLADAIQNCGIFTGSNAIMFNVGFKTGHQDEVLMKIADRVDDEIDTSLSQIISVLEPTLVAIISVLVGLILLSVMLPLIGILSSIS